MLEVQNRGFNEVFLSEISDFDSGTYAYQTFFNCDKIRFSNIAKQYGKQHGYGASSYMFENFYAWKNGQVNPNINTRVKIITSTISTFTIEEKFVEAYSKLAKHIKFGFPKAIEISDLDKTFEKIIEGITQFDLEKHSHYSSSVFKKDEIRDYQEYVQNIFKFYTKVIFDNINKDIPLILKTYDVIDTKFLTITFKTYLFNIAIDTEKIDSRTFNTPKVFNIEHTASYEDLMSNTLADFSLSQIANIAKASNTTKIDAWFSETEIYKFIDKKIQIENSKNGGAINYVLKTNSGLMTLNLRILSEVEKLTIIFKLVISTLLITGISYYSYQRKSFFLIIVGLCALSFLVSPIYKDTLNLTKDIIKPKRNGRK